MTNFDMAVEKVLSAEGGYSDRPNDSGGATNHGISLRFLREIPDERLRKYSIFEAPNEETIKHLTVDQAKLIYKGEFWLAAQLDHLNDPIVASYVMDMVVLHGIGQGVKILQRATWAVTRIYNYLTDDGVMGHDTITAVNQLCASGIDHECLMSALCSERAGFCRMLVEIRPKDRENLHGWLERCYRIYFG